MNKKNNVTDKNIKIKTTGGTTVNIACSYAKDKTLECIALEIFLQAEFRVRALEGSCMKM